MLDSLFVAARNTLAALFNDKKYRKIKAKDKKSGIIYNKNKNKSEYLYKDNIFFGAAASLHTFGSPLDWNPRLHVLVCENAHDTKNDKIKSFNYMDYNKLRQTWRYQILDYLDNHIDDNEEFQRLKLWFYTKYTNGFYVHAPKIDKDQNKDDVDQCVRYITRYTSRPIMSEKELLNMTI